MQRSCLKERLNLCDAWKAIALHTRCCHLVESLVSGNKQEGLMAALFTQRALLPPGGDAYWACSRPMKRPVPKGHCAGRGRPRPASVIRISSIGWPRMP